MRPNKARGRLENFKGETFAARQISNPCKFNKFRCNFLGRFNYHFGSDRSEQNIYF